MNDKLASDDEQSPAAGTATALKQLVKQPLTWLLVALPVTVVLEAMGYGGLTIFLASAVAIIPLAGLMGRATENLAHSLNPSIGGLLNATFGNAAELIIALFALARGPEMYPIVKASITGSIIGNVLLVMGASMVAGGYYYRKQQFNRTAASMGATLLALAATGLIMPALFYHLLEGRPGSAAEETRRIEYLSEEIAAVLAVIYLLSLIFTLVTHRDLFTGESPEQSAARREAEWSVGFSLAALLASTAGLAWMSHLLVGTLEQARESLGMNEVFTGVIVVAVIGNAAEHSSAILLAAKNPMDAAVQIAVGSGIQVALLVAPVLVFASMIMGHEHPLDLHFSLMETITVAIAVAVVSLVCHDGETHWMEGVLMLGVYVIIALAFYNLPM
ncbi:MAG: calcium/proton exchanger [Pirellulales bacterium]